MRNFLCMTIMAAMLSISSVTGAFASSPPIVWALYGTFSDGSTISGTITMSDADVVDWAIVTGNENYTSDGLMAQTGALDGQYSQISETEYMFGGDGSGADLYLSFALDLRDPANEALIRVAMVEGSHEDVGPGEATLALEGYARVPEPASLAMLGIGILAVGSALRRRRG